MRNLVKITALALLASGLFGTERVFAQARSLPYPTAAPAGRGGAGFGGRGYGGHGGYGGYGGGYGGYGGGYGGYGGYGGMMMSPFNPFSPYSPYNPLSPISPYYNPYNAGVYSAAYLFNPLYNPGLMSGNPMVQMNAALYANVAATNLYSYSDYYAMALQNQQAMANMYTTQMYQMQAQQQYVNAQAYSTMAQYQAMANTQAQQQNTNPYAQPQPQQRPALGPMPAPQPPPKNNYGFTAATSNGYDGSFLNSPGVVPTYNSAEGPSRSSTFQVKAPPPTYTEAQMRIQADKLVRIQRVSSPGEIVSGFAQNELLKDIGKFINSGAAPQSSMPPVVMDEETLRELNVVKNAGNLGAIRLDGKITWPVALGNYVLTAVETKKFEETTTKAIESAIKGKVDGGAIISMGKQIDDFRSRLVKKVNDIPTNDYLEAKRFLNDLDDSRLALQRGEWAGHMRYQTFIAKGKTVQELAKFMVENGLTFAQATGMDEGSYKAAYSALAAYDLHLNAQFTQVAKE